MLHRQHQLSPAPRLADCPHATSGSTIPFASCDHSSATPVQVMVSDLWLSVLQALARVSMESNEHLRNHALVILHQ